MSGVSAALSIACMVHHISKSLEYLAGALHKYTSKSDQASEDFKLLICSISKPVHAALLGTGLLMLACTPSAL